MFFIYVFKLIFHCPLVVGLKKKRAQAAAARTQAEIDGDHRHRKTEKEEDEELLAQAGLEFGFGISQIPDFGRLSTDPTWLNTQCCA